MLGGRGTNQLVGFVGAALAPIGRMALAVIVLRMYGVVLEV